MQDSNPKGRHMTEDTFFQVLEFVRQAHPMVVNVTGGEPTEHPLWRAFSRALLDVKGVEVLSILTNGSWIEDAKTRIDMARFIRESRGRVKVQVYSNPEYYKNDGWTVAHKAQFLSIGCTPDFGSPIFMQDLGRARKNCTEEVESSDFVPSCINSHLLAMQARSMTNFFEMCIGAARFCRPLIDIDGGIHMSESWLCQTVAHVSDGVDEVFRKMKASRPCGGCRLYRNFVELHPKEMEMLK
jgi:hypothetical protein